MKKRKEKNELFTETYSDIIEAEKRQHKKMKKKERNELLDEAHSNFIEAELKQDEIKKKKKRNESLIESYCDFNETELKQYHKKKEMNEYSVEGHSEFNENELQNKKKEKKELFTETYSDIIETEIKQHKRKKKKERDELLAESHSNFIDAEFKQKEMKGKNELLVEPYSGFNETELKQHKKKKREKNELLIEAHSGVKETELKQHKKKRERDELLLVEAYSNCNETELKQHHKKKKNETKDLSVKAHSDFNKNEMQDKIEKNELLVETYSDIDEIKQHKNKKKKKGNELLGKSHSNFIEDEFKLDEIKEKNALLVEAHYDFNETKLKQEKKKERNESTVEEYSNFNESKLKKKKKKEKNEVLIEAYSTFNEAGLQQNRKNKEFQLFNKSCSDDKNEVELKPHKKNKTCYDFDGDTHKHLKKKKEKTKLPDFSLDEFQNEPNKTPYSETCILSTELEEMFSHEHKHRKNLEKENDLNAFETFNIVGNDKIPFKIQRKDEDNSHVSEAEVVDYNKNKRKHKICKENLNPSEKINRFDVTPEKQKSVIEVNNYECEVNSSNTQEKENTSTLTETFLDIDKPETISKKHKKKKKHSSDTEAHILFKEHDYTSSYTLNETMYKENDVTKTISDKSEKLRRYKKKHKANEENIFAPNFNTKTDILNKRHSMVDDFENSSKTERGNSPCEERIKDSYFSTDLDCSEDPVDFEIPPLHMFETVCPLTEKQKKCLPPLKVLIKTGKFTTVEDKIIRKNFEDFVKKYQISDTFSLLGIGNNKNNTEFSKFLKAKHFYIQLAKDLNDRTLHSIYKRARVILHPYKNAGKLTEKEIDYLKKLHVSANNKWQWIADTMGNTAERCADTYRWHEKDITKGHFTEEETSQLIEALKKVSGSSDISCTNIKSISWETVASYVPSRNASQCRMYWAHNLAWEPDSARKRWTKKCYCKLVHILKELNVKNSSEINWYKVYESFKNFAPSPLYVQKRWLYLRSKFFDSEDESLEEILKYLCNKYPL